MNRNSVIEPSQVFTAMKILVMVFWVMTPWRSRQHGSLKRWYPTIAIRITAAVKASKVTTLHTVLCRR